MDIEALLKKHHSATFLLGMATSVLLDLKNDPFISGEVKTRLIPFVDRLLADIDKLYYTGY